MRKHPELCGSEFYTTKFQILQTSELLIYACFSFVLLLAAGNPNVVLPSRILHSRLLCSFCSGVDFDEDDNWKGRRHRSRDRTLRPGPVAAVPPLHVHPSVIPKSSHVHGYRKYRRHYVFRFPFVLFGVQIYGQIDLKNLKARSRTCPVTRVLEFVRRASWRRTRRSIRWLTRFQQFNKKRLL